ncbi:transmembrane emp24 domain-containing protein p24delta3-like [Hibiscus syriacus]|uniref:Transmembrane emp24 domain-containing protein p24delta3-like n=1 Tax=Hibiscus syriacus TaxID=106335 RepID=A0A6A3C173_HIBSY|nr:transmembrane emp24 domain-containing protein p24delta3-like [Hibiscus syriacus]
MLLDKLFLPLILNYGKSIDFWNDYWTEVASLKESFPRIYGLAIKKSGCVNEFGSESNGEWHWNIEIGRAMFVWESDVWDSFLSVLNRAAASSSSSDTAVWLGSPDGQHLPKHFCELVSSNGSTEDLCWRLVWDNIAPPKVEAFMWKVMHGRIPMLVELSKRGACSGENTKYQALHDKNFDPSAIEDLMKLFEIESYKAWTAMDLEHEEQVKQAEITMQEAEDYLDSVMETAMDEFRRFEEEMERDSKDEADSLEDAAEKAWKMGNLMEKGATIASKLYVEATMKMRVKLVGCAKVKMLLQLNVALDGNIASTTASIDLFNCHRSDY